MALGGPGVFFGHCTLFPKIREADNGYNSMTADLPKPRIVGGRAFKESHGQTSSRHVTQRSVKKRKAGRKEIKGQN